jgi:hypothetical protein
MSTTRRLIEEVVVRHGQPTIHELRERTDIPLLTIYPCVDRSDVVELHGFEV